jgi:DNA-directed RNA polymerase subunit RPC12/RpoP
MRVFVTRLFHCPECDSIYDLPVPEGDQQDVHRICSRCWRRFYAESDRDSPSGPVDEYPLSE